MLEQPWKMWQSQTHLLLRLNWTLTCSQWGSLGSHAGATGCQASWEANRDMLGALGFAQHWRFLFSLMDSGCPGPWVWGQAQTFSCLPCAQQLCTPKGLQLFTKKEGRHGPWERKKSLYVWIIIAHGGSMSCFGCVAKEESPGCLQTAGCPEGQPNFAPTAWPGEKNSPPISTASTISLIADLRMCFRSLNVAGNTLDE